VHVVAGGQPAPLGDLAGAAFDDVAAGVAGLVEADRAATGAALAASIGGLVAGLSDGVRDAATAQQRPVGAAAVAVVSPGRRPGSPGRSAAIGEGVHRGGQPAAGPADGVNGRLGDRRFARADGASRLS
jgi:hypothetical protein